MRWFRNDPTDDGSAPAAEASHAWWTEPSDAAGVPPLAPDFDAIVGGAPGERPTGPYAPEATVAPERRRVLGGLPRSFEPAAPAGRPIAPFAPQAAPAGLPPAIPPGPAPAAFVPVFGFADDVADTERDVDVAHAVLDVDVADPEPDADVADAEPNPDLPHAERDIDVADAEPDLDLDLADAIPDVVADAIPDDAPLATVPPLAMTTVDPAPAGPVDDADVVGDQHDATGADAVLSIDTEEPPVPVGTDEGTYGDDVAAEPLDLPEDADAPFTLLDDGDLDHEDFDDAYPAVAEPVEEIPVPVAEIGLSFGERIERLIAAAVTEAENTRADARHEAAALVQSAQLDAEHAVAAAQRQSAEIVAGTQRRCDDELAAAQRTRDEAEQVLADARAEAETLRRRVRDEVAELRSEIDLHAQAMLARTHADTNRTLASARAELEELTVRRTELEGQLASIRALLSDAVVEPLPHDLSGFLAQPVAVPEAPAEVPEAAADAAPEPTSDGSAESAEEQTLADLTPQEHTED